MSNYRYLEIDSAYRDRKLWPLASEFQIPISQSGRKEQNNALDPVSLATPIFTWTGTLLDISNPANDYITGTFEYVSTENPSLIDNENDLTTFIIRSSGSNRFQQLKNYYTGLIFTAITSGSNYLITSRIIDYIYMGNDGTDDRAQITLSSGLPSSYFLSTVQTTYNWQIYDPTDFADLSKPYLYVPCGRIQQNAYCNYILYNETINDYRPILSYDPITHLICLNTKQSVGGSISGSWNTNDNFSIRKKIPTITTVIPSGTSVVNTATDSGTSITYNASTNTLILQGANIDPSLPDNYYKNCGLRINFRVTYEYETNYKTLYETFIINNSYSFIDTGINTLVLISSNAFSSSLTTLNVNYFEILNFSYDNFNPFTYTGSLVSQQEMVCYEIELLNLILPNAILDCGEGGRIAFYPYVYVTLSNVSASGAGLTNILYSNNPHAVRVIFRVPIDDLVNPLVSTFVHVDGDGMVQTMKFKPNDNLYFSVTLSNGEKYKTILEEYYSPAQPNPAAQITACFAMKRL